MTAATDTPLFGSRLFTFEVLGAVYALPISDVLEVVESSGLTCVPTIPRDCGGVMNWHGEALPVVAPHLLLGVKLEGDCTERGERQFLVLASQPDEVACLALPIDRVTGLVDGEPGRARGPEVVVERKPFDGRIVSVIDSRRLMARALEVIDSAAA